MAGYFDPNRPIVPSNLITMQAPLLSDIAANIQKLGLDQKASDRQDALLAMQEALHPGRLEQQRLANEEALIRNGYLDEELRLSNAKDALGLKSDQFKLDKDRNELFSALAASNIKYNKKGLEEALSALGLDPNYAGAVLGQVNALTLAERVPPTGGGSSGGFDLGSFMEMFKQVQQRGNQGGDILPDKPQQSQIDQSLTPDLNTFQLGDKMKRSFAGLDGRSYFVDDDVTDEDLEVLGKANGINFNDARAFKYSDIINPKKELGYYGQNGTYHITKEGIKPLDYKYKTSNGAVGTQLKQLAEDPRWNDDFFNGAGISYKKEQTIRNYEELAKAKYGEKDEENLKNYSKQIQGNYEKTLTFTALISLLNMSSNSGKGMNLQYKDMANAIKTITENGSDLSSSKLSNALKVFGPESNIDFTAKEIKMFLQATHDVFNQKNSVINFSADRNTVKDKDGNKYPILSQEQFKQIYKRYSQLKELDDNKAKEYNDKQLRARTVEQARQDLQDLSDLAPYLNY